MNVRHQFPALARRVNGRPAVFLDGPAGSQVPQCVIDAMTRYLTEINANLGGSFVTSRESGALVDAARRGMADFLGCPEPALVSFGANMTTLTLALARALACTWKPGDEIVVNLLEHDANFTPWTQAAQDAGATVRTVGIRPEDCTLDLDELFSTFNERTRFVAIGAASNAVGTINPVTRIVESAHAVGARVFVDAVHYAPHALIDVTAWGCDYLACSPYKFFGPHMGVLYGKREAMTSPPAYKLRPCSDELPWRWELGTLNHEGIAGTLAAVDYLASLGRSGTAEPARRDALRSAFESIVAHERALAARLLEGLAGLDAIRVWGISDLDRLAERVPTVSLTHARLTPAEVAEALGRQGIFVWHGNYYSLPVTEALGLEPEGMVRIGILHYNTAAEVDRVLEALGRL